MRTTRKILEELRQQHARDEARLDEILAEIRLQGRSVEQAERRERAYAELAKFNQELFRRNEIVYREGSEAVAEVGRALVKEVRENSEWVRAQTQAIFRILDLLKGDDGPPAEPA